MAYRRYTKFNNKTHYQSRNINNNIINIKNDNNNNTRGYGTQRKFGLGRRKPGGFPPGDPITKFKEDAQIRMNRSKRGDTDPLYDGRDVDREWDRPDPPIMVDHEQQYEQELPNHAPRGPDGHQQIQVPVDDPNHVLGRGIVPYANEMEFDRANWQIVNNMDQEQPQQIRRLGPGGENPFVGRQDGGLRIQFLRDRQEIVRDPPVYDVQDNQLTPGGSDDANAQPRYIQQFEQEPGGRIPFGQRQNNQGQWFLHRVNGAIIAKNHLARLFHRVGRRFLDRRQQQERRIQLFNQPYGGFAGGR